MTHQDHTAKSIKCGPGSPRWKSHAISASKWTAFLVCPCCSGKGRISCSESPEGLILLALPRTCPTASLVLCSRERGVFSTSAPPFWQYFPPLLSQNLSSDATESALRLSTGPVTTPHPRAPPRPPQAASGYSEFCILPLVGFDFFCVSTSPSSISSPCVVLCCDSGNSG